VRVLLVCGFAPSVAVVVTSELALEGLAPTAMTAAYADPDASADWSVVLLARIETSPAGSVTLEPVYAETESVVDAELELQSTLPTKAPAIGEETASAVGSSLASWL